MRELFKMKAIISMKTNDQPKITVGSEINGSHSVTFDVYGIDINTLLTLVGKELILELKEGDEYGNE